MASNHPPQQPRDSTAEELAGIVVAGGARFHLLAAPYAPPPATSVSGRILRYRVLVEPGLEPEIGVFGPHVDRTLGSPHGWARAGFQFARVAEHEDFTVLLAKPETVNKLCRPLKTGGVYSCGLRGRAVLNAVRWRRGVRHFKGDLATYREYLVNHEVGHLLGQPHRRCPPRGGPAPLMMQQTKHVGRCQPNGRPLPREIEYLRDDPPDWTGR